MAATMRPATAAEMAAAGAGDADARPADVDHHDHRPHHRRTDRPVGRPEWRAALRQGKHPQGHGGRLGGRLPALRCAAGPERVLAGALQPSESLCPRRPLPDHGGPRHSRVGRGQPRRGPGRVGGSAVAGGNVPRSGSAGPGHGRLARGADQAQRALFRRLLLRDRAVVVRELLLVCRAPRRVVEGVGAPTRRTQ